MPFGGICRGNVDIWIIMLRENVEENANDLDYFMEKILEGNDNILSKEEF